MLATCVRNTGTRVQLLTTPEAACFLRIMSGSGDFTTPLQYNCVVLVGLSPEIYTA